MTADPAFSQKHLPATDKHFNALIDRINLNIQYLMDLLPTEKRDVLTSYPTFIKNKLEYIHHIKFTTKKQFIHEYLAKSAMSLNTMQEFTSSIENATDREMAQNLIQKIQFRLNKANNAVKQNNYRVIQTSINKSFGFLGTLDNILISDADNRDLFDYSTAVNLKNISRLSTSNPASNSAGIKNTLIQKISSPLKKVKKIAMTDNEDFEAKKNLSISKTTQDIDASIEKIRTQINPSAKTAATRIVADSRQALAELENSQGVAVVAGLSDSMYFSNTIVGHPAPSPTPKTCIEEHPQTAETECPTYFDFYTGVEFTGSDEFNEAFPTVGMRVRGKIYENSAHFFHRLNYVLKFGLTSRVAQAKDATTITVDGKKALEGRGGLLFDFKDFTTAYGDSKTDHKTAKSLGLLVELGFNSIDGFPKTATTSSSEGPSDLFQHHFAGLRLYNRGSDKINGAYLDAGWGVSENFQKNEYKRYKFRGYLPIRTFKGEGRQLFKPFAAIEIDSDFDDGEDEVKMTFGASIEFETLLSGLGGIITGDK